MAQAARLHLRMQKEIKSLHDDPPHGVSVNENDLSSLSTIEAKIKGPEGTVYAKGVFILKIQIPERYPFQPPNVTFVTPIYHPNIDNGGRICLDILNLPPKGAWKPSLNIATVLISIGLLLSEPNPDDGLMAEISREYKYNRQVFDINAQLWTEKYASPSAVGASCWGSVDAGVLAQNTQMEDTESQGSLPNSSRKDCEGNQRKIRSLGQKLSLKSERSEENMKTAKQDPVGSHLPSMEGSTYLTAFPDVSGRQDDMSENMSVRAASKNLQSPDQGLSVASDAPKRSDGNDVLPNHLPTSASDANDHAMQSFDDILQNSLPRSIGGSSDSSNKLPEGNRRNIRTLGMKLSLGQKLSLKSERSEENMKTVKQDPVGSHLPSMAGSTYPTSSFPDISVRQDDMSQNISVVASKKEYKGNNKNLQLPDPGHSVASEAPSKRDNGNDVLPNHLGTSASDANDHAMQSSDDVLENSLPRSIGESSDSSYKLPEGNRRNIRTLGMKLSLKSIKPEKKSDDDQKENVAPSHLPPQQGSNKLHKRPLDAVSRKLFSGGPALVQQSHITERQQSNIQVVSNEESNQGRKKLCSLSRRLALKSEQPVVDSACEEYKPPNCSLSNKKPNELPLSVLPAPIPKGESVAPNELPLTVPAVLKSQAKSFAGGQKDAKSGNSSVNENVVALENIVVSDSEDSEEEREKPPRSRLSLMRRRLAGKLRT